MLAMKVDKFAPVKRADGYALSEERLDWQLDNWADWEYRRWDAEHGFEVSEGHSMSKDFDQMCAEMDLNCAAVTAAAIAGLEEIERGALFAKLLGAVFKFPPKEQPNALSRARWRLARDLYVRGLV